MQIDSAKIRQILADRTMTQRQLAMLMGRHPAQVSIVLKSADAGVEFQPATVGRIAQALGVTTEEITRDVM
ncbi:MAG: helix-turn-helix transcriptional regulator [Bryobacteraceae bacterium]